MKKLLIVIVSVAMLVALAIAPLTVNAADAGFVTVTRNFTITADNIKQGNTVKMNPRLWWQFAANTEVPFAFEIANVTIRDSKGTEVEKFIASAPDSLELGSSVPPAGEFTVGNTLKVNSGWELGGDNQTQVWSNGTKDLPAGDYTFNVDLKISEINQDVMDTLDETNMVRLNIWGDNIAAELFPTDEMPISLEELKVGTKAFNNDGTTETPSEKEPTDKAPATGDASMAFAMICTAGAVFGGIKFRKK